MEFCQGNIPDTFRIDNYRPVVHPKLHDTKGMAPDGEFRVWIRVYRQPMSNRIMGLWLNKAIRKGKSNGSDI